MHSSNGGIRAGRIEAHNIVSGIQVSADGLSDALMLKLAQATMVAGAIDADSMKALNVVSGLQVLDGSADDLRVQLARQLDVYRAELVAISDGLGEDLSRPLVEIAGAMAREQLILSNGSDLSSVRGGLSTAIQNIGDVADAAEQTGRAIEGVGKVAAGLASVAGVISRAFGVW